jgi:hypothetical protein
METFALSDAIEAFLVCVAHDVAPVESLDRFTHRRYKPGAIDPTRLNKPDLLPRKASRCLSRNLRAAR